MKLNLIKIIFFLISIASTLSCKQYVENKNPEKQVQTSSKPNKKNSFERTKWKASSGGTDSFDVILDFYTSKNVAEYSINAKGEKIAKIEGTYKSRSPSLVVIKWDIGKPLPVEAEGRVNKKTLTITRINHLEPETYYKVEDY